MKTRGLIHIFSLDDDRLFQCALEKYVFEKLKFPVLIKKFQTAQDCLCNLHQMPDLIILDYFLGESGEQTETGIDVLDQIRKKNRQVPVIMLSGHRQPGLAEKAIRHGANEFIEKNSTALQKTHDLIRDAIQSLLVYGGAEKYPIWRQNKPGEHQRLYLSLHPKSHTFFTPITLPDSVKPGKSTARAKRKKKHGTHPQSRSHETI